MRYTKLAISALALGFSAAINAAPDVVTPITATQSSLGTHSTTIELVKALAWPLVALTIAAVFRQPLGAFITVLGSRITKVSLFKVELELVPAKAASAVPLLDDIQSAANGAEISDSSRMMLDQLQSGAPADYAEIALGAGEEWITSRLYIAAVMMERMRGLKCFVFVEGATITERRFVAIATVSQLRWALARHSPWLEAAWLKVVPSVFPQQPADPQTLSVHQPIFLSNSGALDPSQARQVVSNFIASLQKPIPAAPYAAPDQLPVAEDGWVEVKKVNQERASFVTRRLLASLLSPDAFRAHASDLHDAPRAQRTRAILRCRAPFVALVDNQHEFEVVRIVNRQALLEQLATSMADEPEAGS
jgi:hypothetical protein